ncbi:hypothetical protein CIFRMM088M_24215 [Citrobacter freundii]
MIYSLRKKLTNIFALMTLLTWLLMLICFFSLKYTGVKIQYFLVPLSFCFPILWYVINPDKNK